MVDVTSQEDVNELFEYLEELENRKKSVNQDKKEG